MVACLLGYKDIVKFLLEKGANANEKCTEEMNTPLHYACTCMLREYIVIVGLVLLTFNRILYK